jgi:hypothetical protein
MEFRRWLASRLACKKNSGEPAWRDFRLMKNAIRITEGTDAESFSD